MPKEKARHEITTVAPKADRIENIKNLLKNPINHEDFTYPASHGSETKALPVIYMDIDMLIHNGANRRIKNIVRAQENISDDPKEYKSKVVANQENVSMQNLFHKAFIDRAQETPSNVTLTVYEEIKNSKQQTITLIIDLEGVVIDGNRRLSCFREFSNTLSWTKNIKCAVLPTASSDSSNLARDIEIDLHSKVETRMNYGYYENLDAINELKQEGLTFQQIGEMLNKKEKEVEQDYEEYQASKRVLSFRKKYAFDDGEGGEFKDNDIARLDRNQIQFDIKRLNEVQNSSLDTDSKKLRALVIQTVSWGNAEGQKIGGDTNKFFGNIEEIEEAVKDITKKKNSKDALKEIEAILKKNKENENMDLVNELNQKIKSGVDQLKEKSKTKKKKDFTLKQIKAANSKLEGLKITADTYKKSDRVAAETNIKNIKKNINKILKEIEQFHDK